MLFKLAFKTYFDISQISFNNGGCGSCNTFLRYLSTVVDSYAGAEGASSARLIVRSSVSLMFPLPLHYRDRIKQVEAFKI